MPRSFGGRGQGRRGEEEGELWGDVGEGTPMSSQTERRLSAESFWGEEGFWWGDEGRLWFWLGW